MEYHNTTNPEVYMLFKLKFMHVQTLQIQTL